MNIKQQIILVDKMLTNLQNHYTDMELTELGVEEKKSMMCLLN